MEKLVDKSVEKWVENRWKNHHKNRWKNQWENWWENPSKIDKKIDGKIRWKLIKNWSKNSVNKLEAKLVEKFIPLQLFVWEFVSVVVWGVCTRNALGDKKGILGSCYYFLQCSLSSSKMSQTKPMCRRSGALPLPHFSWNSWHIHTYLEKISEKKEN